MAPQTSKAQAGAGDAGSGRKTGAGPSRKLVDTIKEATGASEEDVTAMLAECGGDADEATARLIESALAWLAGRYGDEAACTLR